MLNFVISLFLGMIPEVLYFTLFIIFTKKVETKRIRLFLLLALGYILLIMICRYQLYFYLGYIVYSYLVLKYLYKAHISDIFVYSISFCYLMVISLITFKLIDNYIIAYLIDRIILYIPIVIANKYFNKIYIKYRNLWNKSNEKRIIKSITLRNISLTFLNILILLINIIVCLSLKAYIS